MEKTFKLQIIYFIICTLLCSSTFSQSVILDKENNQVFEVDIANKYSVLQCRVISLDISIKNATDEISGFEFLIAFNDTALTLQNVTPGPYILYCDWEEFEYGFVPRDSSDSYYPNRLISIRASSKKNIDSIGCPLDSIDVLATMHFVVKCNRSYECDVFPINFYWKKCNDNIIYSSDGRNMFISNQVYAYSHPPWRNGILTKDTLLPHFGGTPAYCLSMLSENRVKTVARKIDYKNGVLGIIGNCFDLGRGDVNLNGIVNEINDVEVFKDYFLKCNLDAFIINKEGQIASTEVNGDGIPLTIGDLVYLLRIIIGDAKPLPKKPPKLDCTITLKERRNKLSVISSSDASINGLFMNFYLPDTEIKDVKFSNDIDHMTLEYNVCHDTLNVLVYSIEKNTSIYSGESRLFEIRYSGEKPRVAKTSAANYEGHKVDIDIKH